MVHITTPYSISYSHSASLEPQPSLNSSLMVHRFHLSNAPLNSDFSYKANEAQKDRESGGILGVGSKRSSLKEGDKSTQGRRE